MFNKISTTTMYKKVYMAHRGIMTRSLGLLMRLDPEKGGGGGCIMDSLRRGRASVNSPPWPVHPPLALPSLL